jgi:hypothetical protein
MRLVGATIVLALLLVAACGDEDLNFGEASDDTPIPGTTETPASEPTPTQTPI